MSSEKKGSGNGGGKRYFRPMLVKANRQVSSTALPSSLKVQGGQWGSNLSVLCCRIKIWRQFVWWMWMTDLVHRERAREEGGVPTPSWTGTACTSPPTQPSTSASGGLTLCSFEPALQWTNTENSKQIFPQKELRGHSPNFHIHLSVSDLYIPTIDLPTLLQEICGPILGMHKSFTDTWMCKLGLKPRNSQKRNT